MTRRLSRVLLVVLLSSVLSQLTQGSADSPSARRPNVLFISVDDLRTSLGCYGDPLVKSPHLDQFAATARLFDRAYVQQAVCGPSRTSVLTGRLPDDTRVWHNRNQFRETHPDLVTLPQLFKQSGYRTVALGKVFSGNEKELDPASWSGAEVLRQPGWKTYLVPENRGAGKQAAFESPDVADDAYPDGKLTNLAIRTLDELKERPQPFFLAVGFFKPHLPFNAPRRYWDLYETELFNLPDGEADVQSAPELAKHSHRELGGYRDIPKDEQLTAEETRRLRHAYYACVSYVDVQVGKLLRALTSLQLDNETIVVIWGDHGYSLGEMNRWCKATNFERDTRVPLMIRVPNLAQPGVATDALVEMVDLYPTLAELAGLTLPDGLAGRSLVPILDDPQTAGRDVVLSQFNRPWERTEPKAMGYSIRTETHRYTRWINWGTSATLAEELYDYASSGSARRESGLLIEHTNIVSDASSVALRDRLREQMDDVLATRSPAFVAPIPLNPQETDRP